MTWAWHSAGLWGDRWACETQFHLNTLDIWLNYNEAHLNSKNMKMKVYWSKSLNSLTENSEDEISTTNWEATCLLLFVQTLVTHKPEHSQRADVRQPKQEAPFGLIRVSWLVLIFSPFYKQRFRSYFYNFTLKEFLSSDLAQLKLSENFLKACVVCSKRREEIQVYAPAGSLKWCTSLHTQEPMRRAASLDNGWDLLAAVNLFILQAGGS